MNDHCVYPPLPCYLLEMDHLHPYPLLIILPPEYIILHKFLLLYFEQLHRVYWCVSHSHMRFDSVM